MRTESTRFKISASSTGVEPMAAPASATVVFYQRSKANNIF